MTFVVGLLVDDDNDYDEISIIIPRRIPVLTATLFRRDVDDDGLSAHCYFFDIVPLTMIIIMIILISSPSKYHHLSRHIFSYITVLFSSNTICRNLGQVFLACFLYFFCIKTTFYLYSSLTCLT